MVPPPPQLTMSLTLATDDSSWQGRVAQCQPPWLEHLVHLALFHLQALSLSPRFIVGGSVIPVQHIGKHFGIGAVAGLHYAAANSDDGPVSLAGRPVNGNRLAGLLSDEAKLDQEGRRRVQLLGLQLLQISDSRFRPDDRRYSRFTPTCLGTIASRAHSADPSPAAPAAVPEVSFRFC